jgi:hypothetical protein
MTLEDEVDPTDVNEPPTYSVPLFAEESDDEAAEDAQQMAFIEPPVFVAPRRVNDPSALRITSVPPSAEYDDVDEDELDEEAAKGDCAENQSRPAKAPPRPTLPMRPKSMAGRSAGAGAGVDAAMAAGMRDAAAANAPKRRLGGLRRMAGVVERMRSLVEEEVEERRRKRGGGREGKKAPRWAVLLGCVLCGKRMWGWG